MSNKQFVGLLLLMNSIGVGTLLWAAHHGMEFTDESYYYQGYLYADHIPDLSPDSSHRVFDRFLGWLPMSLVSLRWIRVFLSILAAAVLSWGVARVAAYQERAQLLLIFAVVLGGVFLSFSWGPMAISYNSMSYVLMMLVTGLWLLFWQAPTTYEQAGYGFGVGFFSLILFFIKITNSLLVPFLLIVGLFYQKKGDYKRYIFGVGGGMLGLLVALLIFSGGDMVNALEQYLQANFAILSDDPTHSFAYIWTRYKDNFKDTWAAIQAPALVLLLAFVVFRFLMEISKASKADYQRYYQVVSLIVLVGFVMYKDAWIGGAKVAYQLIQIHLLVLLALGFDRLLSSSKTEGWLFGALALLPIIGCLGTNNGLSGQLLIYGGFIGLMIYYLTVLVSNTWFKQSILFLFVALSVAQGLTGTILDPYRQVPLTKATYPASSDALHGIQIDQQTNELAKILNFLKENDSIEYIFADSQQKGMALLVDKKPYTLQWVSEYSTCAKVKAVDVAPEKIAFITTMEYPLNPALITCLEEYGIFWERDFQVVRQVQYFDHSYQRPLTLQIRQHKSQSIPQ
ncbi:MAG: hypothetical protein ACFCUI_13030 [Bernardetiaceae bacterium]